MKIADSGGEGVYPCCLNECFCPFRCAESFFNFFVVNIFGVQITRTAEIVGFAFDKRSCSFGVFNYFFCLGNDFFIGSTVIGLGDVYVDEFESRINSGFGGLNAGAVVEIDIHFKTIFFFIIVDHVAHISESNGFYFSVAEFCQYRGG